MEIKYICTYWGKNELRPNEVLPLAKEAGYDGIELNVPFDDDYVTELKTELKKNDLVFVAQQWLPPKTESVQEYKNRLLQYLKHLSILNPVFINSHTGKDYFSFEDNCSIIEDCFNLNLKTGIEIIHETHRGRFSHHAYSLLAYIKKYKNLALTGDFSHFCAVSESLLEDQEEVIEQIIPRCKYIHARVGFDQAAQVNHPFAPEWKPNLSRFVGWWERIIAEAEKRGEEVFYICPEFGPYPYMPQLPYTQQPVADQWEINRKMMEYLKKEL